MRQVRAVSDLAPVPRGRFAIASLEAVLALEKPGEMSAEDLVGVELVA